MQDVNTPDDVSFSSSTKTIAAPDSIDELVRKARKFNCSMAVVLVEVKCRLWCIDM